MTYLNLTEARKAEAKRQKRAATRAAKKEAGAARATESLIPALFNLGANTAEDTSYRRLSSPAAVRDLSPMMQERMQAVCFYLAATNPFAKRIVDVITEYVVGEGVQVVCEDPDAQEIVDDFWSDEANVLNPAEESAVHSWSKELSTFGEVCLPAITVPYSGAVRLGYIDPSKIEAIEYGVLTNDAGLQFMSMPIAVRLKRDPGDGQQRRLNIIRRDDDPNSETHGRLIGDCFYFAVNKAKGGTRGLSDLFTLADWADVFDAMMFDSADRVRFLSAFVWDVTVNQADEKRLKEVLTQFQNRPLKQGGLHVHNEATKLDAVAPDLKGADLSAILDKIRNYGLGGAGLPSWFFADGSGTNRSTADEMTGPTGKKLTSRQNQIKRLVTMVVTYVLEQANLTGTLRDSVDQTFKLQLPDLMIKDLAKAGATMGAVTNSLSIAEENGWVRSETAAQAFHVLLSQIGVEIDSQDEFKQAQQEMQDRLARQVNTFQPQKNLAAGLQNLNAPAAGGVQ